MFQNPYANLLAQNQYYPQMNNQQIFPQEQTQNLIRVNGIDGAKTYQMSANSTVALFDSNEDIMYILRVINAIQSDYIHSIDTPKRRDE